MMLLVFYFRYLLPNLCTIYDETQSSHIILLLNSANPLMQGLGWIDPRGVLAARARSDMDRAWTNW